MTHATSYRGHQPATPRRTLPARILAALFGAAVVKCKSQSGEFVDHCWHHNGTGDYKLRKGNCEASTFCDVYRCCRCPETRVSEWDF